MRALRLFGYFYVLIASAGICLADPAPIKCASDEKPQLIGGAWKCCGSYTSGNNPPLYYCTNRQQRTSYQKECSAATQGTFNVHTRWTGQQESCSGSTCNGPITIGYYPDGVTELELLRCDPKQVKSLGKVYTIFEWTRVCERVVVAYQHCVNKPILCGSCLGGNAVYRTFYSPQVVASRPPVIASDSCAAYNYHGPGTMLNDAMPKPPETAPPGGEFNFSGCSKTQPPSAGKPRSR